MFGDIKYEILDNKREWLYRICICYLGYFDEYIILYLLAGTCVRNDYITTCWVSLIETNS